MALMLWRVPYEPLVKRDVPFRELTGVNLQGLPGRSGEARIILGASSSMAFLQLETWRRLLLSAGLKPDQEWGLFPDSMENRESLRAIVIPDRYDVVFLDADMEMDPDRPIFAALLQGQRAEQLVLGPPTEEVWEAFECALTGRN